MSSGALPSTKTSVHEGSKRPVAVYAHLAPREPADSSGVYERVLAGRNQAGGAYGTGASYSVSAQTASRLPLSPSRDKRLPGRFECVNSHRDEGDAFMDMHPQVAL